LDQLQQETEGNDDAAPVDAKPGVVALEEDQMPGEAQGESWHGIGETPYALT
jgi:hypothetical protein